MKKTISVGWYLPLVFACPLALAVIKPCDAFKKIASPTITERIELLQHKLSDFKTDPSHANIPIIKNYLGNKQKEWFSHSIELNANQVDPIYANLARTMGHSITLGGGSDLIEVALLKTAKLASPAEVNLIMERELWDSPEGIMSSWKEVLVSAPEYLGRAKIENKNTSVNGESGNDLLTMVKNDEEGKILIQGYFPLVAPFKHGYAAVIEQNGKARLFFRTLKDAENYSEKILTLPEEEQFPSDWHTVGDGKDMYPYLLKYHLSVYARAKAQGWRYSPISYAIIKSWAERVRTNSANLSMLKEDFFESATKQGVSASEATIIWKEFGF